MNNLDDNTDKINNEESRIKFKYLKKGEGKLASDRHINTKFAQKRKEKILMEQNEREKYKYFNS